MRIKKLMSPKTGVETLAVQKGEQWIPIKPLIESHKKLPSDALGGGENLIALLYDWKKAEKQIKDLLEAAGNFLPDLGEYSEGCLPFHPVSYRDFMLCEQHVIDSSRGFARELNSREYEEAIAYEKKNRKTYPNFMPKPLWYEKPIYYMGNHLSFLPNGSTVKWPGYSNVRDYELEIGMIITRPLFNATEEEAREAVGGFTIFNDLSARDVQPPELQSGFGPVKAKNFANVMADVVVTPDELLPYLKEIGTRVLINGRQVASGTLESLTYRLETAVAYASLGEHIYPGEFMGTGTIAGCSGLESGILLEPDDLVCFEVDRIGEMQVHIHA